MVALWRKRWVVAVALGLAAITGGLGPLATPRLSRVTAPDEALLVRVLVFNGSSGGLGDADRASAMLLGADADVIVLLEPSTELLDVIRASEEWTAQFPFRRLPDSAKAGWRVVFTRWPQRGGEEFAGGAEVAAAEGMHVMIVQRPAGAFGFVQFNPESPRTLARWRRGNVRVTEAIEAVRERLLPREIPVLAAGDMNATGSGGRSRRFARESGLKRAKAWWTPRATYPAWLPGFVGIAIDDVWASPEVKVVSWERLDPCGSDHRPVLVTLEVPR